MRTTTTRKRNQQRPFQMKGCSKKRRCSLGGGSPGTYNQNRLYPYEGPKQPFPGWLGSSTIQSGGSCDACTRSMTGGRRKRYKKQKGGYNGLPYGNNLPPMKAPIVPNGLTGSPWNANFKWPGTDLVQGNFNHYSLNKYIPDVVTAIKDIGANFPFLKGGGGRRKLRRGRTRKVRGGGFINNTFFKDIQNGVESVAYNNKVMLNNLTGRNEKIADPSVTSQPYLVGKK
jgi:hypothetical protein